MVPGRVELVDFLVGWKPVVVVVVGKVCVEFLVDREVVEGVRVDTETVAVGVKGVAVVRVKELAVAVGVRGLVVRVIEVAVAEGVRGLVVRVN